MANRELSLAMHIGGGDTDRATPGPRRPMPQGWNRDDDERWRRRGCSREEEDKEIRERSRARRWVRRAGEASRRRHRRVLQGRENDSGEGGQNLVRSFRRQMKTYLIIKEGQDGPFSRSSLSSTVKENGKSKRATEIL
jgi:hypothetical protein